MLDYNELTALAQQIKEINVWDHYTKKVERRPSIDSAEWAHAYRSEAGVSLMVLSTSMGWKVGFHLDLDPDNMPADDNAFLEYINSHIFIRLDNPERTVPPPDDPASAMLQLSTVLRATWMTAPCPYLTR